MGGSYLEPQGRVHVQAILTLDMLLHAKKEASLHCVATD